MDATSAAFVVTAKCHPRVLCRARHCGRRQHLNDDLDVVTLSQDLLAAPPADLWPTVVRRLALPPDVEALLLGSLAAGRTGTVARIERSDIRGGFIAQHSALGLGESGNPAPDFAALNPGYVSYVNPSTRPRISPRSIRAT
jgi:hypothetical protein